MESSIDYLNTNVYAQAGLSLSDYQLALEGSEYVACQYKLNNLNIESRTAKITPKKAGLFVTFWKRNANGIIAPLSERDSFDYYVVNIKTTDYFGQFVFPKSVLLQKGIISSQTKEGKRAFRVYPPWVEVQSKQAINTQKWQQEYFYEISTSTNFAKVKALYTNS